MGSLDNETLGRLVPAIRVGSHQWTGEKHQGHFEVSRQIPFHVIDQAEHHEVFFGFYDHQGDRFYHLKELGLDSSEHLNRMQQSAKIAQEAVDEGATFPQAMRRVWGNDFIRRALDGEDVRGIVEGVFPSLRTTAGGQRSNRTTRFGFKGITKGGAPTPLITGRKKKEGVRYRDSLHHVVDGAGKTEFRVYGKRDQVDLQKKWAPINRRKEALKS